MYFAFRIFGYSLAISAILVSASPMARAVAIITGSVEAQEACAKDPMEAWLSAGSTLLYQVDVPQNGTFEFHVNSGKYNVVVISSSGCLAETTIEARENDTRNVVLKPIAAPQDPKADIKKAVREWRIPSASTPSRGERFAAKPALYVNGPDGTAIKIRTRLGQGSSWLVTVPGHGEKSWSGTIEKNHFISANADYRYIYYDYRMDEKKLQDSNGFCAQRGELIPKLTAALKSSGFKANEIKDFADYWTIKIPPSERYCVYPQSNTELQAIATLEIEPKPSLFKQILFIVQFSENLGGKGKFRSAPIAKWKPTVEAREPAAAAGIQIREWGVGFLR